MNKEGWLALAAVLVAVIAVAFLMSQKEEPPRPPAEIAPLTISNFHFSEVPETEGAPTDELSTVISDNRVNFVGPTQKPTPCNGLNATYSIEQLPDNRGKVTITISATPYEGFCTQVIANTFYQGYFDIDTGFLGALVVIDPFSEEVGRKSF
jgi:hypothetical protein